MNSTWPKFAFWFMVVLLYCGWPFTQGKPMTRVVSTNKFCFKKLGFRSLVSVSNTLIESRSQNFFQFLVSKYFQVWASTIRVLTTSLSTRVTNYHIFTTRKDDMFFEGRYISRCPVFCPKAIEDQKKGY